MLCTLMLVIVSSVYGTVFDILLLGGFSFASQLVAYPVAVA